MRIHIEHVTTVRATEDDLTPYDNQFSPCVDIDEYTARLRHLVECDADEWLEDAAETTETFVDLVVSEDEWRAYRHRIGRPLPPPPLRGQLVAFEDEPPPPD